MTRAFPALALRARSLRSAFGPSLRDVRSAIRGSAVERRLLAKAPVLILTKSNNKNGPQGPAWKIRPRMAVLALTGWPTSALARNPRGAAIRD